MFDFFREMYAELNGLDPEKIREKKGLRKKDFILSRTVILAIRIIGIFYFFIAAFNIISLFLTGVNVILFKYVAAVIVDAVVLILTFYKSRINEIIVIAGAVIFIGINFFA